MNQSEKSEERKDKTGEKKALDLEELGAVSGGEFMSGSGECSDRDTYKCTGNPYNCRSTDENKRFCTFG
ncbi:hypothetical protein [Candidatus Formimonas warabiya]|uniref:Uncharacterized protein n=1 Tax=Formimonas warabiya TaxID=1761012 RepID=A0A3G1KRD8_FORW1|nr:hypothetical protein [Candidatus Formimonas warabiya]ATW24675.1 hypothetical protein DCMF_07695 [Candidatus Formimonas warabiya]